MLKHLAACLLGVAALVLACGEASAEKRVALVIGNSAYQHTAKLKNPSNDATDIAAKLRELGFTVIDGTDLSKDGMEQSIRAFADKLAGADVGLFFYAGHGLQVDGRNFLTPIDAKLRSDTDLDFEAVELDLVLKQLERNARLSIVFLDACRDNPLAVNLAQASRSLEVGRGLARVDKAIGMMIAFSTQPGNVALDGEGRNSPFTDALLRHIATEGASINDMMIDVRNDVLKATGGKQVPWENSSLTGQFFFKPAAPQAGADNATATAADLAALRKEIDRLQTNQGAMLAAQQEQLEALQQKLAAASGTAEPPSPAQAPTAPARVITVEPAGSPSPDAVAASAPGPNPVQTPAPRSETVASAETPPNEAKSSTPTAESAPSPLPEDAAHQQLASDIVAALKTLDCYQGDIAGTWGQPSQDALKRFNDLSHLDLALDEPEQATLDALKDWKGAHCTIQAAVTPDATTPKAATPSTKTFKKAVKPVPKSPKAATRATAPRPKVHSGQGGSEAQQELQRAFPSTNWPGNH